MNESAALQTPQQLRQPDEFLQFRRRRACLPPRRRARRREFSSALRSSARLAAVFKRLRGAVSGFGF
jgi:hypothetical protein